MLDSGPVSFWRPGEFSGTSAADSSGSNTGTYTNGPTLAQSGALAGDADTAVSFDGSNDYVTRAYTAVVGTYDGSTALLYVNGTSVGSVTTTYGANASEPIVIGAYLPSGASYQMFLPGVIDGVAVYNRALTATGVQLHYDSGRQ